MVVNQDAPFKLSSKDGSKEVKCCGQTKVKDERKGRDTNQLTIVSQFLLSADNCGIVGQLLHLVQHKTEGIDG